MARWGLRKAERLHPQEAYAARPRVYRCPVVGHDAADSDGSFLGHLGAQRTPHGVAGVVVATDKLIT